ncbi:hypothetical protein ALC62_14810 [Cyphomyrmex costatus]|uniref:CCHC-type domain-containing protein n=1 Tax=Cyphomyrmex costatus TaxID=456900 RepID=A0A151I8E4_9HYME|nr:hypothetical protein ALC62_14810 [Cyphomyrmex costatus]
MGKGKILIEATSAITANRITENPTFAQHNLRAFIPAYKVLRIGVIQDVPVEIDLETLRSNIKVPYCKIIDIQRLNRRIIREGTSEYIPSKTLRIKFLGQHLPEAVFIFRTRHEVRPYIPRPKICYSCYRAGHIAKVCKGEPRCLNCGNKKHAENEICPAQGEPIKCINCQGNHSAISKDCSHIFKHEYIIGLAATANIPIANAKKIVSSYGNNIPRTDLNLNSGNFPLFKARNHAERRFNFESYNPYNLPQDNVSSDTFRSYADVINSQSQSHPRKAHSQRIPTNNLLLMALPPSREKAQVCNRSLPALTGRRTATLYGSLTVDPRIPLLMGF